MNGDRDVFPHKILIVDDESLIRWSLAEALVQEGFDVVAVENGQKAVEVAERLQFDYVITDLVMPERDGWEVLSFFRETQPRARVILITACGGDNALRLAKEKGAWAYVEKPYVLEQIKGMVKRPNPRA